MIRTRERVRAFTSASEPSEPAAPANTVAPVASGTGAAGTNLTTTNGTWTGYPTPTFTYQWFIDGETPAEIEGATSNTYEVQTEDEDEEIFCRVTATNSEGSDSADSNAVLCGIAPVNTEAPVASGTAKVGETLSVTDGTWTGTATITYAYQWRRDAVAINGATSNTYELVSADAETDVDCVVTATNDFGNDSADSNDITIAAEGGSEYLDSVIASACCDLDATISDSYPGTGQTWANLIASPADGASQTDYDFYLGADGTATTDDPTFTGTAGDAASYWSFDGGDLFVIASGANTPFLRDLHKAASDFWFAVTARAPAGAGHHGYFTTQNGSTGQGLHLYVNSNDHLSILQRGDSTNIYHNPPAGSWPEDTDNIGIWSFDKSTGKWWHWANSGTSVYNGTWAMDATTVDATAPARIGVRYAPHSSRAAAGTRMYSFAFGNELLDDTKAQAIIAHLEARHGRTYVV